MCKHMQTRGPEITVTHSANFGKDIRALIEARTDPFFDLT